MSFRKRNVGLVNVAPGAPPASSRPSAALETTSKSYNPSISIPGVRPSPYDGRPTTSTGTLSLDGLLAGHAGLPLGNSLLVEESGVTEYASTLLRYFAAEGVVQGHKLHVVGMTEVWGRELPGVAGIADAKADKTEEMKGPKESMKIAWRYEKLGNAGPSGTRASPLPNRGPIQGSVGTDDKSVPAFCHVFDLTKRLTLPSPGVIDFMPIRAPTPAESPFKPIIRSLKQQISSSSPNTIHRVVIPSLLSPAFYPPLSSKPQNVLPFLHSLRALLREYPTRLSVAISLPVTLYPRETGLTRWIELLSDGVLELIPFPHTVDTGPSLSTSGAATAQEEKPQGMAKIHRLPVFHERGGGGVGSAGVGDDLAFTVTRKRFVIKPFSLPPVEGDTDAQQGKGDGKNSKVDIEF